MLTRLVIESFGRVQPCELELGPIVCLIGENQTGRSTLLKLMAWGNWHLVSSSIPLVGHREYDSSPPCWQIADDDRFDSKHWATIERELSLFIANATESASPHVQLFITSQNPLVLDHIPITRETVRTTFIRCETVYHADKPCELRWRNLTEEEAERLWGHYDVGISQLSECLRTLGLW
jgi:hypothetical protein